MRFMILFLGLMLAAFQPLAADSTSTHWTQAIFISVKGDVRVIPKPEKKAVAAQTEMTLVEGARIIARSGASAVLRFFDGSELTVAPQTEFVLTKLQKPSADDKILKFDLFIGKLTAVVKALVTSHSSFEIETGGVVCGVRGTEFSLEIDPSLGKALLLVDKGIVAAQQPGGPLELVKAGGHLMFGHLHLSAPSGSSVKHLSSDVGAPVPVSSTPSPLNNPALKSMLKNTQIVVQTNKTNLVKTIQQNSSVGVNVGPAENVP